MHNIIQKKSHKYSNHPILSCTKKKFQRSWLKFFYNGILIKLGMCLLSDNIMEYHVVSQGKTSIPGVDDGDELVGTDVRKKMRLNFPSHFFTIAVLKVLD